jgi:L-2-hydroxycarboxylate dehydrogenase (NAD+)
MQEKDNAVVLVEPGLLQSFMCDVLLASGVSRSHAETVSQVLCEADKRGIPSHGCARFKGFYVDPITAGLINPKAIPEVVRDVQATAVVDAHLGLGHPAACFAMDLAIEKAKKFGMGFVAVRNSNHYGIAAWYAQRALAHNMIGLTGTNARPSVAPTNGVDAMFGTNPIAFAMPADDECPFVFDAATTIAQRGKVETYARRGKALPEGWVVGADGSSQTDAQRVLNDLVKNRAALLPLGGLTEESGSHKGFGFATIVEILSASLQQGNFLRALSGEKDGQRVPNRIGHFFFAMNLECFGDIDEIRKSTGVLLRELRASTRRTPEQEILTAGMREHRLALRSAREGVAVDAQVATELKSLREQFGLNLYKFPFD